MLYTAIATMHRVALGVLLALFSTCRLEHPADKRLLLHNDIDIQQVLDELRREINATKQDSLAQKAHLEQEISAAKQESLTQKSQLEQEIGALRAEVIQLKKGQWSTYVRWGRTTCPGNGTETVYAGYTAGSVYNTTGGAANSICLPSSPSWAYHIDGVQDYGAKIYGTEFETAYNSFGQHAFGKSMQDQDVPCALCHSPRPASVMIPGSTSCYHGWTLEYTGYIMAGGRGQPSATEYACVDKDPEAVFHGEANQNGHLFYFTEVICGSLPCQEYPQGRELACVVCSK